MSKITRMSALTVSTLALTSISMMACQPERHSHASELAPQQRVTVSNTASPGSFEGGAAALTARQAVIANTGKAKNVIVFIVDGMGVSTITASRIYTGQKMGQLGEDYVQAMETLPYTALVKTYNVNQQVPDSAGTATAIMTGTKTRAGVINVGPAADRKDCAAAQNHKLPNLAQIAASSGRATGVVSTARLTHATPATFYSQSPDRNWESPRDISKANRKLGCTSIAEQMIEAAKAGEIDVALGGGSQEFTAKATVLTDDWPGTYVTSAAQMRDFDSASKQPLLG